MMVLMYILCVAALILGVWRKSEQPALGTGLIAGSLAVSAVLLLIQFVGGGRITEGRPDAGRRGSEMEMARALGEHVAGRSGVRRAICLVDPANAFASELREGLREGVGEQIMLEFVEVDPADDPEDTEDGREVTLPMLRGLLERHSDADLFIVLTGVMVNESEFAELLRGHRMRVVFGKLHDLNVLGPFVDAGVFAGGTLYRSGLSDADMTRVNLRHESINETYFLVQTP